MPRPEPFRAIDPATLPHVWRVHDLAPARATVPTGSRVLDAALPGGGWPSGSLIEILQHAAPRHVWRLLTPALVAATKARSGPAVLVSAPLDPFGPSLSAQGLPPDRLLCVQAESPALRLWAAEQALRCAEVAAVLAWLPAARHEELRRLHLAAQQHDRLLFVFRGLDSRSEPSPAPLRLMVQGVDELGIQILKRRGPPMTAMLKLPVGSHRLMALLAARRGSRTGQAASEVLPVAGNVHVLDRTAAVE